MELTCEVLFTKHHASAITLRASLRDSITSSREAPIPAAVTLGLRGGVIELPRHHCRTAAVISLYLVGEKSD
jgi:hypothetical protein